MRIEIVSPREPASWRVAFEVHRSSSSSCSDSRALPFTNRSFETVPLQSPPGPVSSKLLAKEKRPWQRCLRAEPERAIVSGRAHLRLNSTPEVTTRGSVVGASCKVHHVSRSSPSTLDGRSVLCRERPRRLRVPSAHVAGSQSARERDLSDANWLKDSPCWLVRPWASPYRFLRLSSSSADANRVCPERSGSPAGRILRCHSTYPCRSSPPSNRPDISLHDVSELAAVLRADVVGSRSRVDWYGTSHL